MAKLTAVTMPKWGMEMTEGEITEWHIAEGDRIEAGSDVVDVETAKIVNTVTSNEGGTVARLCAAPGEIVPVGGLLVVLSDGTAGSDEVDAYVAAAGGTEVAAAASEAEPAAPAPSPGLTEPEPAPREAPTVALREGPDDRDVPASVVARRVAAATGINLNNLTGSGRHGRVSLSDLRKAAVAAGLTLELPERRSFAAPESGDDSTLKATPVARRLARELGVDLNTCRRTGRHGRISKADVEAAAARLGEAVPATPAPELNRGDSSGSTPSVTTETLTGARRTIANAVSQAKREVPHFRVNVDVDVAAALALRKRLSDRRPDTKVSLNDILVKACALALDANPALNARFDGDTLERHEQINIASAVATEKGVLMPVLPRVAGRSLGDISEAMRDLATRAKTGQLRADEIRSATFSISNLGMFGIDSFDAIINQPAVAILAVGTASDRALVRDGELCIGKLMSLSLASDHRVVDGADAARFLADLRSLLEDPALMLG